MSISDSDFGSMIENHMKEQPYTIACSECGVDLEFDVGVDAVYDLILAVNPCNTCMEKAVAEEGK